MKLGFFQYSPVFGDVQGNLNTVINALADAQADLLVLPELAFTGYFFKDRSELMSLAEDPAASATVESLMALCRRQDFYIVTGFAERRSDKVFNSALLIGPRGLTAVYRKLHLFDLEKECFDPGDLPLETYSVCGVKVGMMICFDWVFPEAARTLMLRGAQVICHPCNLVLTYCQAAMLTRCLENRVFAVTANRYGKDLRPHGELSFTGQSQIAGPHGELLHRAAADKDELSICEIDPSLADDKMMTGRNHLMSDRRPEWYFK